MGLLETAEAFTMEELKDIYAAAQERGVTFWELVHEAVLADLVR